MTESKLVIQEDVFVDITKNALQKVNEVFREEKKGTLAGLTQVFAEKIIPHIAIRKIDSENSEQPGSVSLDMKLSLVYGVKIPEAVHNVKEAVTLEIENLTGYKVEKIDIIVDKLVKPDKIEIIDM